MIKAHCSHVTRLGIVDCHSSIEWKPGFFTGSLDGTLRLWSHSGGLLCIQHGRRGFSAVSAIHPSGRFLFDHGENFNFRIWDLSTSCLCSRSIFGGGVRDLSTSFRRDVVQATFNPSGDIVSLGCSDGIVRL